VSALTAAAVSSADPLGPVVPVAAGELQLQALLQPVDLLLLLLVVPQS
jgi:hypothetical protein